MGSLYEMYYGILGQAFGASYEATHGDLLAFFSTCLVMGTLYFTVKLGGKLIKKWCGGDKK